MSIFLSRLRQARRMFNAYEDFLFKLSVDGLNANKTVSLKEMQQCWYSIADKVKNIQGWVPDTSGMGLYQIARFGNHNGLVVELGSWKGRSTVWLASGIKARGNGSVYAVDTWKGSETETIHKELLSGYKENQLYDEFTNNLKSAGIFEQVFPIISDTGEAAKKWDAANEIGLLFVDASHEYEGAKADFIAWGKFVQIGGFIVFDDIPSWEGPTKVISELPQGCYRFIGTFTDQYVVQKIK